MLLDFSNTTDVKKGEIYFTKLVESNSRIELKKINNKRSISLNSYLHVCINLYAIHFGYTLDEAKTLLKRMCNFMTYKKNGIKMTYKKNGIKFLKQTSKLDNKECSIFVEWIRNHASEQGCYIPDAEEYKTNKFTIDKDINNHKQYL